MEKDKSDKNEVSIKEKPTDIGPAFDTMIEHVGEMGTYQRLLFLSMLPFGVCWAFVHFGQMFITATPQEHWCAVPELEGLSMELRRNLSIPGAAQGTAYDQCLMYDANWTQVLETLQPPPSDTATVPCRDGWVFLLEDIPYSTVVSERGWVCGSASLVPISQAIFFVGAVFGGLLCGVLADKFGRLPVLVLANTFGCIGGIATMFTSGFWDFAACRFIMGMSSDCIFLLIYILVLEYVGIHHRTWVANFSIAFYFGSGCIILPWLALWISDWRYLCLATSLPMLLSLLMPFLAPESARWLISKGKIEEAVKILRTFERVNKTKIPENALDNFIYIAKTSKEPKDRPTVLYTSKQLRIVLITLTVSFLAVAALFDGLIRLSETLGLDFFITFTVTSATEVPSIALLVVLLDRFGRRSLVFVPSLVAGLLTFAIVFVERGVASVALATAARFFTNMAYSALIQWTPELMPTGVRASGSSIVHISAYVGGILSPFVVFSERAWEGLSVLILAIVALIGACAALLLPETAGRAMPQTLEDGEQLAMTRLCYRKRKGIQTPESSAPPMEEINS